MTKTPDQKVFRARVVNCFSEARKSGGTSI